MRKTSTALFSPPERVLHRRDSLDEASRASFTRRMLSAALLGGVAITTLAPVVEQVSSVWQGRDEYVALGRSK